MPINTAGARSDQLDISNNCVLFICHNCNFFLSEHGLPYYHGNPQLLAQAALYVRHTHTRKEVRCAIFFMVVWRGEPISEHPDAV